MFFFLWLKMNDRELLELAAKAAGINVIRSRLEDPMSNDLLVKQSGRNPFQAVGSWNPLTHDGDALRLAVKIRLRLNREISFGEDIVEAFGPEDDSMSCHCSTESTNGDHYAATRRAIVRAAAEIGRQMQKGGAA